MLSLLSLYLIACLAILSVLYWYLSVPRNLPPGPRGLPFLGSCVKYFDGSKQHLMILEDIKKYGPLFKVYIANKLVVILGDYRTVHEALVKQADVFAGRPQWFALMPDECRNHGLAMAEGELWKEQRRFTLHTLRDFGMGRSIIEPRIKEEMEYLTERISLHADDGKSCDLHPLLTCATSNIISQLIFGRRFDFDDREFIGHFAALCKRSSSSGIGFLSPFLLCGTLSKLMSGLPWARKLHQEVDDFAEFTRRQLSNTISTFNPHTEPTNYIHAFLKTAQENRGRHFDSHQLTAAVIDLFIAGTETTSSTIRWGILLLAHNPEIQDELYNEMNEQLGSSPSKSPPEYSDRTKLPLMEATIMEIQRYSNLVPFGVPRRTLAKTKLMGYDIPADAVIIPFLTNVLHNGELFPEPAQFRPRRFLNEDGNVIRDPKLIPFQAGKRMCLGESLGRMELFLILTSLLCKFRFYFPEDQPKPTLEPIIGIGCMPTPYTVCVEGRRCT